MVADIDMKLALLVARKGVRWLGYKVCEYLDTKHPGNNFDTASLVYYVFMLTSPDRDAILRQLLEPEEAKTNNKEEVADEIVSTR